ncbi:MAG: biotin transporter BioY [Treponema sp.]|nr:biotin transporter BioY [Treponema sp.]
MTDKTKTSLIRTAFTLAFTALTCLSCFFSIKFPTQIPVTLQNFFCILAGLILGGTQGAGSAGLFLILGALGLPVFTGIKGGWEVFTGVTGGYLWGYFPASLISGIIAGTPHVFEKNFDMRNWLRIGLASIVGFAVVYLPGIPWLIHFMKEEGTPYTLSQALTIGFTPFISIDIIKIIVCIPIAALLRPFAAKYLYPDDEKELEELMEGLKKRKDFMNRITGKNKRK